MTRRSRLAWLSVALAGAIVLGVRAESALLRLASDPGSEAIMVVLACLGMVASGLCALGAGVMRTQRQLRAANTRLTQQIAGHSREFDAAKLIVQNTSTILYRMSARPDFALTYISPNIARLGLDAAALLADPHWFESMISESDVARVVEAMRGLLSGNSTRLTIEYRVRARRGRTRWVENRCVLVCDAHGQKSEIEGVVFDVTGRKEAQLALHEREAFTRAILDSISVEVAVLDLQGVIVAVNEQWRRFSRVNGVESQTAFTSEHVGSDYLAVCRQGAAPDSDGAVAAAGIAGVLGGALPGFTLDYGCDAPGRRRWFRMHVTPLGWRQGGVVVTHEDITARKLSEAALGSSEQLLERTGRIGGIGGWKFELATRSIHWTDQAARIHDLGPSAVLTVEAAMAFYPPASRAILDQALQHSIATGEGYDLEVPMTTATGRRVWVRTVSEVEFEQGRPVRLTGTFQDVTTRRAMENDLRTSHELLATALEALPCGICVIGAAGRLVAWNAQYLSMLQLPEKLFHEIPPSLEEVVRTLAIQGEYGPCDIDSKVCEVVHAVMTAPAHHPEQTRPDGSTLEIRGARMPGGGVIVTFTDISARRNAEAAAQQSTRLLGNAVETVDEAFVLFGRNRRLIYSNEKYRALYGNLSHLVVAGASVDDLAHISDSTGLFATRGEAGEPPAEPLHDDAFGGDVRLTRLRDGRILRSVERVMPDGHTVGMLVDVTEHMHATEVAQQALMAKGQFLANISHEIRTPMNAILGLVALLERTSLGPRQRDYLTRTEGAARAHLGLLNAVLDFSKIDSGAMRLDVHAFCLETLLRELSLIVSVSVGKKALDVRFDIDEAMPPAMVGDALRLHQVLLNLLGNAIKFTAAGTVELVMRVSARSGARITLDVHVSDTGIGIAPESQIRIFSGFTQAEASTTRRFGGTGLGLAISHRLIQLMGGVLTVDSAVGAGSRFSFAIELDVPPPEMSPDSAASPRAAPLRAMMIADDVASGALLARMARSLGWQVETLVDGSDALAHLRLAASSDAFDIAFVHGPLTGSIGRELAAQAGSRVCLGRLPLVSMGTLEERERLGAPADGNTGPREAFLVQPVTARMMEQAALGLLEPAVATHEALEPVHRLDGMRLLVVEDNPTNQMVAHDLLEAEGALVVLAADGRQALDALDAGGAGFDAVLMDLQMPLMDGYTAARRIRGELRLSSLPIVAMTANASRADRDQCLAAGMNDHVGKPFDLNELVDLLCRLTGRIDRKRLVSRSPVQLPRAAPALAELAGVDLQGALARLDGNAALYAVLLASFVEHVGAAVELRKLAQANHWGDLARRLHVTKGLAATVGANRIAADAARLEAVAEAEAGRSPGGAAVEEFCDGVAGAIDGLNRLQACLESDSAVAAPMRSAGHEDVVAELRRLVALLRASDMAALDAIAKLTAGAGGGGALGDDLARLRQSIYRLHFEEAAILCDALLSDLTQR